MDGADRNLLGTTIRLAREARRLTGEDIREACGVDPTSLSMWERGTRVPPLRRIKKLAPVLGLDPVYLAALALGRDVRSRRRRSARAAS
jgi:transcriptional regulator with XRE-family HTH domain